MQTGWSYIKDSGDFMKKTIKRRNFMKRRNLGSVLENAILVTADLVGLYPSIPHEVG